MPQNTNQAMFGAEEFDDDSDSGSPELNFAGAGSGGAGVGGMPNSQMLSQLRAAIQQDPSVLQQILSQLATTNPQLYQVIIYLRFKYLLNINVFPLFLAHSTTS